MKRWQNWGKPSPWKPTQQPATEQVKADLQDVINKHQAAALEEANDSIRALKEEREAHKDLARLQEKAIQQLTAQVKELQLQQQQQQQQQQEDSSSTEQQQQNQQHDDDLEDLKRQLKERDEIIAKFQKGEHVDSAMITSEPTKSSKKEEEQSEIILQLQKQIQTLTQKSMQQEQDIEKLQNVLKEMESFYGTMDVPEEEEEGERKPQQVVSLDASPETSEHKDEINTAQSSLDDISEEASTEISIQELETKQQQQEQPALMTLNGNQLVLLISSMPMNRTVSQNQSRLEVILQEYLNVSSCTTSTNNTTNEVQILDGCDRDPASINLRNDLFRISGLHAVYPQLFLVNFTTNDIIFVGDFHAILEMHDAQTFATTIGLTPLLG
jgi:chromosome segregation ATPase